MTKKRYFKRMWEEEYYIFDSQQISEKDFDEKVEYEDYQAFADSMTGEEVTDRLNKYNKEYLDCHNDVLRLEKENEQLKQFKEQVFQLIDMRIAHYEHQPYSAPISNPANPNFDEDVDRYARLYELKQLKKELSE